MKSDQTIADALGIEHVEAEEVSTPKVMPSKAVTVTAPVRTPKVVNTETGSPADVKADYDLARHTYRTMMEKGGEAIDHMSEIARQQESARAYEVLALLLKTTSEITRDLYDLQRTTKEIKGGVQRQADTNINVEKAVFVGTTDDMLQQVNADRDRN